MSKPKGTGHLQSRAILKSLMEAYPEVCHRAWRQALYKELLFYTRHRGSPRDFAEAVRDMRLEPDAYVINRAEHCLHFFEIEVFRPMKPEKMEAYAIFAQMLDYYGIDFEVYVVNQYGHINQVDLLPFYVGWLRRVEPPSAALRA